MKKIKYLFILLLTFILFIPIVSAEVLKKADENISLNKDISKSTILAGNNVSSNKKVDGIIFSASNIFKFSGNAEYIISAGNIIELNGIVEKDVVVAGNDITFNENLVINRDVIIAGNTINIKGKINGDIEIYASNVTVDNSNILGNLTIISDTINITGDTVINNKLKYNENAKIKIENKDNIGNIIKTAKINIDEISFLDILISKLISFVRSLVVLLVMILVLPKLFKKIKKKKEDINIKDLVLNVVSGLLTLIIIPILVLILLISSFGTPLGIICGLIYGILIYISFIIVGYFIGNVIFSNFIKKDVNEFIVGVCGIFVIYVLRLIPYINILTNFLSLLLGLGIITNLFIKSFKRKKVN